MSKTRRFTTDETELSQVSNRVARKGIGRLRREAGEYILATIEIMPDNYEEPPDIDIAAEVTRDKWLDVVQKAAEEIVASTVFMSVK